MARRDDEDQPWLAEGLREERSMLVPRARLFGGGLLAAGAVVLVGLGVYLASGHKSDGSAGYARPEDAPLIAADAGAYKVQPADPGGARITGLDDSVAAVAGGRDQGSAILPDEPEEPLARPGAGTAPPAPPTDLLPATSPPATVVAPKPTPAPPPRVIAAAPVVPPPVIKLRPDVTAAKVEPPTAEPKVAEAKPAKPKASNDRLAAIVQDLDAATTAKAAAPKVAGSVALQLGAFSTRDKADAAWAKAGGDGALSGLTKRIEPVERNGATLYRLRAGGVASKVAAQTLCGRIAAAGNACIVAE